MNEYCKKLIYSLLLLLVVSCASPSSHIIIGEKRAPISVSEVKIFRVAPNNYIEIAIVSSTSAGSLKIGEQSKVDHTINLLKAEAASLGANGIILQGVNDQSVMVPMTSYSNNQTTTTYTQGHNKVAQGIAVYVE